VLGVQIFESGRVTGKCEAECLDFVCWIVDAGRNFRFWEYGFHTEGKASSVPTDVCERAAHSAVSILCS
jgi:hypothetical protein